MGDFDVSSEAWDRWESNWYADRQARADKMRVRGYAIACLNHAEEACKSVDKAERALARARKNAERAVVVMRRSLERAELAARCCAADDPEWTAEVAQCLEECFG